MLLRNVFIFFNIWLLIINILFLDKVLIFLINNFILLGFKLLNGLFNNINEGLWVVVRFSKNFCFIFKDIVLNFFFLFIFRLIFINRVFIINKFFNL